VPGVGSLVAMTYKSAIDDPSRITKSKAAGALFGLTPKKYQSGEKDITGDWRDYADRRWDGADGTLWSSQARA
jgi:transposase